MSEPKVEVQWELWEQEGVVILLGAVVVEEITKFRKAGRGISENTRKLHFSNYARVGIRMHLTEASRTLDV